MAAAWTVFSRSASFTDQRRLASRRPRAGARETSPVGDEGIPAAVCSGWWLRRDANRVEVVERVVDVGCLGTQIGEKCLAIGRQGSASEQIPLEPLDLCDIDAIGGRASKEEMHRDGLDEEIAPGGIIGSAVGGMVDFDQPARLALGDPHSVLAGMSVDQPADGLDVMPVDRTRGPRTFTVHRGIAGPDAVRNRRASEIMELLRAGACLKQDVEKEAEFGRIGDGAGLCGILCPGVRARSSGSGLRR